MTIFVYTATDSLLPDHLLGSQYTANFLTQSAAPKASFTRDVVRSLSGKTETLLHMKDKAWVIKFAPVTGDRVPELEELLDSIMDGQTINVWLYGSEAAPLEMICSSDGYDLEDFMALGDELTDMYTTTIELRLA